MKTNIYLSTEQSISVFEDTKTILKSVSEGITVLSLTRELYSSKLLPNASIPTKETRIQKIYVNTRHIVYITPINDDNDQKS